MILVRGGIVTASTWPTKGCAPATTTCTCTREPGGVSALEGSLEKKPTRRAGTRSQRLRAGSDPEVSAFGHAPAITCASRRWSSPSIADVNGTLAALNRILDLTVAEYRAQGGTMVIPNQGRIYDEGDVAEYRDMTTIVRDRVQDAIDKGLSLEQVQGARLARDYDGRYGEEGGPASAREFITTMYRSLSAAPK